MNEMIPGIVMGFREGLEAFLLVAIIIKYLLTSKQQYLINSVLQGAATGVIASLVIGLILTEISTSLGGISFIAKAWESIASFIALTLVTLFIIWMIKHGADMGKNIEGQVQKNLSKISLFLIPLIIVAREGTEIAIFFFAGKYNFSDVIIGISASFVLTILIIKSLVKVNISLLFKITLAYLILQAGFLLGYAIHEALSSLKVHHYISADSHFFIQAYNLSETIFNHKTGLIGLPLHVTVGWYSKPEWVQVISQYAYTLSLFAFWLYNQQSLKKKNVH